MPNPIAFIARRITGMTIRDAHKQIMNRLRDAPDTMSVQDFRNSTIDWIAEQVERGLSDTFGVKVPTRGESIAKAIDSGEVRLDRIGVPESGRLAPDEVFPGREFADTRIRLGFLAREYRRRERDHYTLCPPTDPVVALILAVIEADPGCADPRPL